jgi:hypothetical protein
MELNETTSRILGFEIISKKLENHLNELPIDKWGMGKKANPNESKGNTTFMFN